MDFRKRLQNALELFMVLKAHLFVSGVIHKCRLSNNVAQQDLLRYHRCKISALEPCYIQKLILSSRFDKQFGIPSQAADLVVKLCTQSNNYVWLWPNVYEQPSLMTPNLHSIKCDIIQTRSPHKSSHNQLNEEFHNFHMYRVRVIFS